MKILVVDDDPDLLDVIVFAFQQAGFLPLKASDGAAALELLQTERPDLAVLDINLPGLNGFDLIRAIRRQSEVPLMMLTVRNEEEDVVRALDLGADDYLSKPFSPRVLVARVRALLRRTGSEGDNLFALGPLQLNIELMTLDGLGETPVQLTQLELRFLQLLFANGGNTVATDRILSHVWGSRGGGNRQLLKQLVHRIRAKLKPESGEDMLLQTVPNVGYRLRKPDAQDSKVRKSRA
jgi:DNA-binding response OmpR family regulator